MKIKNQEALDTSPNEKPSQSILYRTPTYPEQKYNTKYDVPLIKINSNSNPKNENNGQNKYQRPKFDKFPVPYTNNPTRLAANLQSRNTKLLGSDVDENVEKSNDLASNTFIIMDRNSTASNLRRSSSGITDRSFRSGDSDSRTQGFQQNPTLSERNSEKLNTKQKLKKKVSFLKNLIQPSSRDSEVNTPDISSENRQEGCDAVPTTLNSYTQFELNSQIFNQADLSSESINTANVSNESPFSHDDDQGSRNSLASGPHHGQTATKNRSLGSAKYTDNSCLKGTNSYIRIRSDTKSPEDFIHLILAQTIDTKSYPKALDDALKIEQFVDLKNDTTATISDNTTVSATEVTSDDSARINATESAKSDRKLDSNPELLPSAVWICKFSLNGQYLAVGGQDPTIKLWEVLGSSQQREMESTDLSFPVFSPKPYRQYFGHTSDILDISWSSSLFLLTSSMDKTVRLWHVSEEACLCCFQHSDFVTSIAFHPKDDKYFLSGSLDCVLRLWSITSKSVVSKSELPDLITAVAFSHSGRQAMAGTYVGLLLFFETNGLRYNTQMQIKSAKKSKPSKVNISSSASMHSLNPDSSKSITQKTVANKVTGIECTVQGELNLVEKLLVTTNDSVTRLYNFRDKALEAEYKGNINANSQIRSGFSEDGQYIICGSENQQVWIWTTNKVKAKKTQLQKLNKLKNKKRQSFHFSAHNSIVTAATFAPIGSVSLLFKSEDPLYTKAKQTLTSANVQYTIASEKALLDDVSVESFQNTDNKSNYDRSSRINLGTSHDIIVTADDHGILKIFRTDCVAEMKAKLSQIESPSSSSMASGWLRSTSRKISQNFRQVVSTAGSSNSSNTDSPSERPDSRRKSSNDLRSARQMLSPVYTGNLNNWNAELDKLKNASAWNDSVFTNSKKTVSENLENEEDNNSFSAAQDRKFKYIAETIRSAPEGIEALYYTKPIPQPNLPKDLAQQDLQDLLDIGSSDTFLTNLEKASIVSPSNSNDSFFEIEEESELLENSNGADNFECSRCGETLFVVYKRTDSYKVMIRCIYCHQISVM